jgi:hypothetical protein
MMTEKDAAICLCMIFLDPVNQLPPPSHRPVFNGAYFRKGANGKDIKSKRWAKPSQKVKHTHRHLFNEGHTNKENTKMNMKKSIEANTKLNMKMKMKKKMKKKIKMNVKRNMTINIKFSMNENMNKHEF